MWDADAPGTPAVAAPPATAPPAPEGDAAAVAAAAGVNLESLRSQELGATEGPLKNVKTVGEVLDAYTALVKEQSKVARDFKVAQARIVELTPPQESAHDQGAELWNKAIGEYNEHGKLSSETLKELTAQSGLPGIAFQSAIASMLSADSKFSVETKKLLGVDSKGFQEMVDKAGLSKPYQEFFQDQVLAGRYGFLPDLVKQLQDLGVAQPVGQQQPGQQPGQQPAPQPGQEPGAQVEMGEPPTPAPVKGWDTENAFQFENNEAIKAEKQGDPSKLEALTAKLQKLEADGIPFYPGAVGSITLQ